MVREQSPRKGNTAGGVKPVNFGHRLRILGGDEKSNAEPCIICGEGLTYAAITGCAHTGTVCWLCTVRMRRMYLYKADGGQTDGAKDNVKQNKCPFCDANHSTLLSKTKRAWDEIDFTRIKQDPCSCCYCGDSTVYEALQKLQDFRCWFPDCKFGWEGDQLDERAWKKHLWDVHKKKLCETCYEDRKANLFPAEHNLYVESDLPRHRKQGDGDGASHYHCRVCHQWLFDEDAYERHWRESDAHEMCTLCYADGFKHTLFNSMENVRRHWQTAHFPCLEASCEDRHMVFRDSRSLQLHMAKEHLRNSSFFENVGRRGILLRLDQPDEEAPFSNRQRQRREKEPKMDDDAACALWPIEMIAEAPKLLECIRAVPTEYFDTVDQCQAAANAWYQKYAKIYFDKPDRDLINWNCHRARQMAKNKVAGVASCLQSIVYLISTRAAKWQATGRQITDQNRRTNSPDDDKAYVPQADPWLNKRQIPLSRRSEILLAIILAVPKKEEELRAAFFSAVESVAKRSEEAKQTLMHPTETPSPDDSPEERDSDTFDTRRRRVLADCTDLPINRNITFIVACEWALRDYLIRADFNTNPPEPIDCPTKVPLSTLDRMRTSYSKEDFETFEHLTRDLGAYIEPSKLREGFLRLRPWYMNHKMQVRRSYRPMNKGGDRVPSQVANDKHSPNQMSKKWGQQCDQVFSDFHPQQLQLLRQYCTEVRALLPSAMPRMNHLVGGVDRREVFDGDNPSLPHQDRLFDTRTRQFVPRLSSRAVNLDDFPTLSASSSRAQTSTPVWTGSPGTTRSRPNARAPPPTSRGAATRMVEPPHTADHFPALNGRRPIHR